MSADSGVEELSIEALKKVGELFVGYFGELVVIGF